MHAYFRIFVKHFSEFNHLCNMIVSNRLFLGCGSFPRFTVSGVSAVILLGSLITLGYIDEDEERHNFEHKGGFLCPFVPYLPVLCILINTYLIINIGWDMDQGLGMATYWKHDLSLLWPISQLTEQCGLRSKDDLYQKNNRSSCLRLVVQCSS
ncbi:hypothetical protein ARALYDRAFT_896415 [Arabidopsis lyrata subsp. lyrata]|uniref:Cationic amino acid transporter C-terminal domain-containing protein n=1 Tax=Arabidopsis lyrata subsp. lyrata TaxID=81972 RepID=D7L1Z8_ARALL|nr:hypothetical protein ARALYDRAFT_896415 [Arabidopsis lyrata subsp. lyrata]